MSLSPEYYKFRDALRAEQAAEPKPKPKVQVLEVCRQPGCNCAQKAAVVIYPMHLDSYADLEALIVFLRAAAILAWGPP